MISSVIESNTSVELTSINSVLLNQWNHFVGIIDFDDKQKVKIYLNGKIQGEGQPSNQDASYSNQSYFVWIGRRKGNSLTYENNFSGEIEDFAMWDRIFTEQEITDLFNKGAALIN